MVCCQGEMEGEKRTGVHCFADLAPGLSVWVVLGFFWRLCVLGEAEHLQEWPSHLGEKQQELRDYMGGKVRVFLGKDGWGLGKVAEMKRNLFMGDLEGQVELGAFFSMFLFLSFQFCLSHSARTSSQPMASPSPGNPQTLSSGR